MILGVGLEHVAVAQPHPLLLYMHRSCRKGSQNSRKVFRSWTELSSEGKFNRRRDEHRIIAWLFQYLGTQEVSSAKGDAVIADCLKELRTLFMEVASHLPKVNITLQMGGITVTDEKSKVHNLFRQGMPLLLHPFNMW